MGSGLDTEVGGGMGGLGALGTMMVVEVEAPTTSLSTTLLPCSPLLPWPRSLGGPFSCRRKLLWEEQRWQVSSTLLSFLLPLIPTSAEAPGRSRHRHPLQTV